MWRMTREIPLRLIKHPLAMPVCGARQCTTYETRKPVGRFGAQLSLSYDAFLVPALHTPTLYPGCVRKCIALTRLTTIFVHTYRDASIARDRDRAPKRLRKSITPFHVLCLTRRRRSILFNGFWSILLVMAPPLQVTTMQPSLLRDPSSPPQLNTFSRNMPRNCAPLTP